MMGCVVDVVRGVLAIIKRGDGEGDGGRENVGYANSGSYGLKVLGQKTSCKNFHYASLFYIF